jgi:hypothetical protein
MNDWAQHFGYQGRIYYRWRDIVSTVVYKNVLQRHRRFEVHHWSRIESQHQTLAAAKRRVMELILADLQA